MSRTVGALKDAVAGLLTGTNLNNVVALDESIERAARTLLQKADVPEASGIQQITLYDGVFDYEADDTIFGGAVTDLRPQGNSRTFLDYAYKLPVAQFDRTKGYLPNGVSLTFEYKKGTPVVRIDSARTTPRAILDPMTDDSGWVAAGSASGLTEDQTVYYNTPASLRFLLTGSSTGTLTKTISTQDLSDYEDVGVAFLAIRIPDGATATNLTSVAIRLGSSSSAYDLVTSTTGYLGAWVAGEWLLVALDFSTATSTGTPDWNNIAYVQIRLAHTATFTNFRVGGLWISLPTPYELHFQSAAIFMASGSNPSRTITNDNDEIILSDPAYTLFEFETAVAIADQAAGSKPSAHGIRYKKKLDEELYPRYAANNPSQQIRQTGNYYDD